MAKYNPFSPRFRHDSATIPPRLFGKLVIMEPGYDHYRSFLLRIWQSGENRAADWRVSLTDPRDGEQIGFDDMDTLITYLRSLVPTKPDDDCDQAADPSSEC